jgi:O-antigen/teichoic acid export membrane protein
LAVRLRPTFDWELCRHLLKWALPLGASLILISLSWKVDVVMLSLMKPAADVGLYGVAFKVVEVLIVLPGYIMVTLLPEFARLQDKRERLDEVVQKATSILQVGTTPIIVIFIVFAAQITDIVGGDKFAAATVVLQILMLGLALDFYNHILMNVLVAMNYQNRLMRISGSVLVLNVIVCLGLIPLWGPRGAAVAFVVSEAAWAVLLMFAVRGIATLPKFHRLPETLVAAGAMAAVGLLKLAPFAQGLSPVLVVCVGSVVSGAVYLAVIYALKAMPREVHLNLVMPLWTRLRPGPS